MGRIKEMRNFRKELYRQFEGNPYFDYYNRHINREQDGNYMCFGAFGELLRDLLLGKIDDEALLQEQCAFIDLMTAVQDPEWNNVLRSEVFSILNSTELLQLQELLSAESNKHLELYL